jgi:Ca2+-binding RTX toxin-like protein
VQCADNGLAEADISLGDGSDTYSASLPYVVKILGGEGNDTLSLSASPGSTLDAGGGDDVIGPGPNAADYHGGGGKDSLNLLTWPQQEASLDDVANDGHGTQHGDNFHSDIEKVVGGSGDDTITGTDGADELAAGSGGNDVLNGLGGNDVITGDQSCSGFLTDNGGVANGGSGNDEINMPRGAVDAGPGDDVVMTGLCSDSGAVIAGGADHDRLVIWRGDPITLSLDGVANDGALLGAPAANVASDFEEIVAGDETDVLIGDAGNTLFDAGGGDDLVDGGTGADTLIGGPGEDAVDYSSRTNAVHVSLDDVVGDDGESGEGDTVASDIEDVYGGSGPDHLIAGLSPAYLDGGGGDDIIAGSAGADYLVGGAGSDSVSGGTGPDALFGDAGDDLIFAGDDGEADEASCGDDTDTAVVDRADDVGPDCETVQLPAAAPAPALAQNPVTPQPQQSVVDARGTAPADRVAPRLSLSVSRQGLGRTVKRGLSAKLQCTEKCSARFVLTISAASARRLGLSSSRGSLVVGTASRPSAAADTYQVTIAIARRYRARLTKARKAHLTLSVEAADAAGNRSTARRSIALRR